MKRAKTGKSAGMSDAAVKAKTGKVWREWFAILDKWSARKKPHKEIATYLYDKQKVPGWWAQMVTVGYERVRGLREIYQSSEGYAASKSITVGVPVSRLYAAWKDAAARKKWMRPDRLDVRTATLNRSLRASWNGGGSRVDVMFLEKGARKSQVAVDHRKLASAKDVRKMKAYWGVQLDRLKVKLEK